MQTPTFHSNYGLTSPNSKQVLIDRIINNCKNVDSSSKVNMSRQSSKDYHRTINNSHNISSMQKLNKTINSRANKIFQEAQIRLSKLAANPLERLSSQKRRISKDRHNKIPLNTSNGSKIMNNEQMKNKNIGVKSPNSQIKFHKSPYQSKSNIKNDYTQEKQNSTLIQQYYAQNQIPNSYEQTKNFNKVSLESSRKILNKKNQSIVSHHSNLAKLHKKLKRERQQHVSLCRQEERKLRLYYIQLQNQLCEMRNRQLKQLQEYEKSKLQQYDQIEKNINEQTDQCQIENQIKKISATKNLHVHQQQPKIQIPTCLVSGVNGILFSFDQNL